VCIRALVTYLDQTLVRREVSLGTAVLPRRGHAHDRHRNTETQRDGGQSGRGSNRVASQIPQRQPRRERQMASEHSQHPCGGCCREHRANDDAKEPE
jgi:hypothetical protein